MRKHCNSPYFTKKKQILSPSPHQILSQTQYFNRVGEYARKQFPKEEMHFLQSMVNFKWNKAAEK